MNALPPNVSLKFELTFTIVSKLKMQIQNLHLLFGVFYFFDSFEPIYIYIYIYIYCYRLYRSIVSSDLCLLQHHILKRSGLMFIFVENSKGDRFGVSELTYVCCRIILKSNDLKVKFELVPKVGDRSILWN